jgi:uncharacterized protein YjiS (DUF1127 family)
MDKHPLTTLNEAPHAAAAAEDRPLLRRGLDGFTTWLQQRRTERLLMACSDRVLADIGIPRDDIHLVARGLDPVRGYEDTGWLGHLRAGLREGLAARRAWWREQAELMAYNDRELADLGIRRRDIPAIVRNTAGHAHA